MVKVNPDPHNQIFIECILSAKHISRVWSCNGGPGKLLGEATDNNQVNKKHFFFGF